MDNGWLKLHRKIAGKGYYKKSEYVHLWIHLILKANHQSAEWMYKNEVFKIERGQMITSRKTLSKETGINESKIERILKTFKSEQQIEQQNLFTSRLITITNYEDYQNSEQQTNSKRTASEQQVNTNKNDKKNKNEKNNKILFGEFVLLTKEEHQKLIDKYEPEFTDACIERLDNYIGSNGKKYKSHYRTILSWVASAEMKTGEWVK